MTKDAHVLLVKIIPTWEARKKLYDSIKANKRTIRDHELEFFMGAITLMDRINREIDSRVIGSCAPSEVRVAAIQNESIVEALQ